MSEAETFTTISAAARAVGRSRAAVRGWAAREWIEPAPPWSLAELQAARARGDAVVRDSGRNVSTNGRKGAEPSDGVPVPVAPADARAQHDRLRAAQLRYRESKAALLELELAQVRGELVNRRDSEARIVAIAHAWRRVLELRARRLAASLVGLDYHRITQRLTEDATQMLGTFATSETTTEAVGRIEAEEAEQAQESVA